MDIGKSKHFFLPQSAFVSSSESLAGCHCHPGRFFLSCVCISRISNRYKINDRFRNTVRLLATTCCRRKVDHMLLFGHSTHSRSQHIDSQSISFLLRCNVLLPICFFRIVPFLDAAWLLSHVANTICRKNRHKSFIVVGGGSGDGILFGSCRWFTNEWRFIIRYFSVLRIRVAI